jgi:hypothetical protein
MARLLLITCLFCFLPAALAQQATPPVDEDGSSQQTEQSDDAFRRSRELEDARSRDQTYIDTDYGQPRELEKIDKLPKESRDNIRNQLIDIIVENGEWEPFDALKDYPYTPTAAAQTDPELKEKEQEAWDEQIAKYHEREAAVWGAQRGPVAGPGNPNGQEGGQAGMAGESGQGGQQGNGGINGQGGEGDRTAGTYNPNAASRNGAEEGESTAGVSESALDFLLGRQAANHAGGAGQQAMPNDQPTGQPGDQTGGISGNQSGAQSGGQAAAGGTEAAQQSADAQDSQQAADAEQQAAAESGSEAAGEEAAEPSEMDLDSRGIIAIRDLDKLEGAGNPPEEDEEENP